MVPFFDEQGIMLKRVLTGQSRKYCSGKREKRGKDGYQLYPAVKHIDHSRSKANHTHTGSVSERFPKTQQDECYSLSLEQDSSQTLQESQPELAA